MGNFLHRFIYGKTIKARNMELLVTMWPSFPHYSQFVTDSRISAVRLNTAMVKTTEIKEELSKASNIKGVPLYVDVKGRQLRVVESRPYKDRLELIINHPIKVKTPVTVVFKAGEDYAVLKNVTDHGHRLVFDGGPEYMVHDGESFHIKHPSLEIGGEQFLDSELEKISISRKLGIRKFFLSYVQCQKDVDEFIGLVGKDSEIILKIEDNKGLQYVVNEFGKTSNLSLMAARGDLYVELERPHMIAQALRTIIAADSEASVGSRILLSVVHSPVPSCADFLELEWLADIGYRKFMMCDDICLKSACLSAAVDAFDQFRATYKERK